MARLPMSQTEAGVGDQGFGMGCVSGDYDNDGNIDLYITNYGPNILYRNNGDGTFADVTTEAGVGDPRWSTGATFGDYDNDGNLDLYVPNYLDYDLRKLEAAKQNSIQYGQYVPSALNPVVFDPQDNMLYRNNGNGTFTDVTSDLGVEDHGGRSFQALFTDLDLDGDLDIYIANDLSPNTLYRNDGNGIFTDVKQPIVGGGCAWFNGADSGRLRQRWRSGHLYEPLDGPGKRDLQKLVAGGKRY